MKYDNVYILNPDYRLKLDKKRVIIVNNDSDPAIEDLIFIVHPVYALILSLFDGENNLSIVIENIATVLKKAPAIITNIVTPYWKTMNR